MMTLSDALAKNDLTNKDLEAFKAVWHAINATNTKEARECFQDVLDKLESGSGYWIHAEDVEVHVSQVGKADEYGYIPTTAVTFYGGAVETERVAHPGGMPGIVLDFCVWWLLRASGESLNGYVTSAARKFLAGDFDGWAMEVDAVFCDLLVQHFLFGAVLYG